MYMHRPSTALPEGVTRGLLAPESGKVLEELEQHAVGALGVAPEADRRRRPHRLGGGHLDAGLGEPGGRLLDGAFDLDRDVLDAGRTVAEAACSGVRIVELNQFD